MNTVLIEEHAFYLMNIINDITKELNPEQLAAVTWPHESALILAGAGSGKTRVLTTRVAWLLQTGRASAYSILAVTFTNKAAKEMQLRLSTMIPYNIKQMWLGTFHGLCNRFLRLHCKEANLPHTFQILDSQDQSSLIKRLLKQEQIPDNLITPKALQGFINAQKEAGLRSNVLKAIDNYQLKLIELYALYEKTCQQESVVDFAELLLRSYEVLAQNHVLREHYQNRFSNILIDEFQDTSQLQYAWLKLLTGANSVLFAVGDDDQSIYAFRGAHVGNMQLLMNEFDINEPIKLEQNYRSMGNILSAANAVINQNPERLGKNLWTNMGDGEPLRYFNGETDMAESQFILEEVSALHREGVPLNHMAVLYRNNAQSRIIEQVLFRAGLAYKIYGGLRFFERQEIKHALAYLRVLANPEDNNALLRIINVPTRGIGARTVERLQDFAQQHNTSVWGALHAEEAGKITAKLQAFIDLITQLTEKSRTLTLPDLIEQVVIQSGLYQMYEEDKKEGSADRLENLKELISAAAQFQPEDESVNALTEFLVAAALEAGEHQAIEGEDALQLMTIHSAKGLEFDAVFLTGLEEGLFPSELSLEQSRGLEEERRLMYVAMTRARKKLYLTGAQMRMLHGKTHFGVPSRFIEEIPNEFVKFITPKNTRPSFTPRSRFLRESPSLLAEEQDFAGFKLGQNVRHATFGMGVIVDAKKKSEGAQLHINFGKQGMKWLDTQFAKLEIT